MANLKTSYLGLELKNPLIVGASPLTANPDKLQNLNHAGAIVIKSLFEEQIELEEMEMMDAMEEYANRNAEMTSLFPTLKHAGAKEHLMKLKMAKQNVDIPVIASLNAINDDTWGEYAKQIEDTGVDAIELNYYVTPRSLEKSGREMIQGRLDTLEKVRKSIKIPIAIKLSPYYTNPLSVIKSMDEKGANGFVLFNRMFQPDIDIEKEELKQSIMLSNSHDLRVALRFTGLLYGNIKADIATAGGVLTGEEAIKSILAGASSFQVVSSLLRNGSNFIKTILDDMEKWMDKKGYQTIDDFKGKLSRKNLHDPFAYHRSQYVDILMQSEKYLFKDWQR